MKVGVDVCRGSFLRRVSWYEGTSDAQVEKAVRVLLRIPRDAAFLLRDGDGDLVPASSALPPNRQYAVVLAEDVELNGSQATAEDAATREDAVKRRRIENADVVGTDASVKITEEGAAAVRKRSTPSLAAIIAQFIEAFTRPIDNDDNVSFIPNSGRFALDELYYELVQDVRCQPKRRDIFYKMTSLYGKVDRQRVVRYYKCQAESGEGIEVVRTRPEGKGSLLRRYRKAATPQMLEDAMKTEPFVASLGLDPSDVVARYLRFVDSFTPISRSDYSAYCETNGAAEQDI